MADLTQNKAWAADKSTFGYKMLMKMGWSEGAGLGKNGDGSASHIRVAKREDALGIGAERDGTGNGKFTAALSEFNDLLQTLGAHHRSTASVKSSGKTLADNERVTFNKRARAKDVTKYSSTDKAAIFCGIPGAFGGVEAVGATVRAAGGDDSTARAEDEEEGEGEGEVVEEEKDRKDRAAEKAARKAAKREKKEKKELKKRRKEAKKDKE